MINKIINGFKGKLGPTKYGAILTMVGKVYSAFISYVTLVIIARLLKLEDFGVYTFFLALVTFFVVIANAGSDNILLSIVSKNKEKGKKLYHQIILNVLLLITLSSISVVLFLLISQNIIGNLLNIPNYSKILLIVVWVIFFQVIIIFFRALNQSEFLFNKAIIPENFIRPTLLFILVAIGLFLGISNLRIILISYLLSFFLTAMIVVMWKIDFIRELNVHEYLFDKEIFKLSPQFSSIQLLGQASQFIPIFLMGIFLNSNAIGIFRASQQTTILVSFILASFNMVFAPTISNLFNKNKIDALQNYYVKTTKWSFILGSFISILVILNSTLILELFGPEYKSWNMVLIILSLGQLINASTGSSGYLLLMTNNQIYMIFLTMIQLFLVSILSWFTLNYFGVYGMALSFTSGIILLNVLQLFFVWKKLRIHPFNMQYIGVIVAMILSTLITYIIKIMFIKNIDIVSSIVLSVIFSLISMPLFFSLGLTKIERKKGRYVIQSLFSKF